METREQPGVQQPERTERSFTTLFDLIAAVADSSESEADVVAAVSGLINSRQVRLAGSLRACDVRVAL